MSTYLLGTDSADDLRRFGAEVVPAVRELVDRERARPDRQPDAAPAVEHAEPGPAQTPFAVIPTADDGIRLSGEQPWDEGTRPSGPPPDPDLRFTPDQQAAPQHLIDIHDGLRAELERLRDLVDQVAAGALNPGVARSLINTMTIRQNNWTLGTYCESYCRIVTGHHTLEDRAIFPHLSTTDPGLGPVLARLEDEHHVIAGVIEQVDRALVALVTGPDGLTQLRAAIDLLTDTMRSHLAYEERELVEPLARLGYYP